ncbi:MAG: type II toxin-antitoxin system HicB family antitoxin [Anaerolineae bacterium]
MEFITLTFVAHREGEYFVSECRELGTSSFGSNVDEAFSNLSDATAVYLETLDELEETHRVLDEKGVRIYEYEPAELEVARTKFPIGSHIHPTIVELDHVHP